MPDNPTDLHEYTRTVAELFKVPYDMAERLFWSESGYQHYNARGQVVLENGGQGVGVGIGQVSRAVARQYDVDPENPYQNIYASIRYLAENYRRFRSWPIAYAAYRAGPNAPGLMQGQIPAAVSQDSVNFFLGVPGASVNGLTVGQGGVPARNNADSTAPGEPSAQPEFIDVPGVGQVPNPLYGAQQAGNQARDTLTGVPAAIGDGISSALTNFGTETRNKLAGYWNEHSAAFIFYGIGAGALILGILLLRANATTQAARTVVGAIQPPSTPAYTKPAEIRSIAEADVIKAS